MTSPCSENMITIVPSNATALMFPMTPRKRSWNHSSPLVRVNQRREVCPTKRGKPTNSTELNRINRKGTGIPLIPR